ncbi:unnamed protein product [Paramecium primaurelia]|uniref:Uncharacterized protein n=1 Tax=Paramecium primaurelia TaxID=5886 RepID=A0A8S1Q496_PARPR|nr:unnamed protein product [Paramecium primaurelia]
MKSSLVTKNGHRTKKNSDHNSKFSYSSCKSCLTSERQTQVKATLKVLYEMREDQSSKLAVKFTQLQISLATQSIIHLISKFKFAKLQTYLRILIQDSIIRQPSLYAIESISLPKDIDDFLLIQIKHKPEYKQRHHFKTQKGWILMQTLNKLKQKYNGFYFNSLINILNYAKELRKFTNSSQNILNNNNVDHYFFLCNLNRIICCNIIGRILTKLNYNQYKNNIVVLKQTQLRNNWQLNQQVQPFLHHFQMKYIEK